MKPAWLKALSASSVFALIDGAVQGMFFNRPAVGGRAVIN